jgi:hypothetical protein
MCTRHYNSVANLLQWWCDYIWFMCVRQSLAPHGAARQGTRAVRSTTRLGMRGCILKPETREFYAVPTIDDLPFEVHIFLHKTPHQVKFVLSEFRNCRVPSDIRLETCFPNVGQSPTNEPIWTNGKPKWSFSVKYFDIVGHSSTFIPTNIAPGPTDAL